MAFDYTYGIRQKSSEEHPFAGVLKQPNEPYFSTTPTQEVFKLFCYYRIGKHLNGSFADFLALPFPIANEVLEECKLIHEEEEKRNKKRPGEGNGDLDDGIEEYFP